jgi:hypothetical protein
MQEKEIKDYKTLFRHYHGREATPADVKDFMRVVDIWGASASDPVLKWLVSVGHINKLLDEIPGKIKSETETLFGDYKVLLDKQAIASNAAARADLYKAFSSAATAVAENVSRKQMFRWGSGALSFAFLSLGLFGWWMHSTGIESGTANGYQQAKDEKAAAAWANTPQGQQAYRFSQSGELDKLAKCSGKGWSIEKGWCFPFTVKDDGTYGWRLP